MDPMTMMMIASAASSLLGGGKKGDSEEQQPVNPFQQRQAVALPGFSSGPGYQAALQKLLQ